MLTSSAKSKGRRFQQQICKDILQLLSGRGLVADDVTSRSMGAQGVDVMLSPAAKRIVNWDIEAKNVEALNVITTFFQHFDKYKGTDSLKLLVHTKNRTQPLVTLRWEDFLGLVDKALGTAKT